MTKTLDQSTDSFVENYSNLVSEGVISTGVNAGRGFFSKENLQGARYSAILDTRVCAYCRTLDGKTIKLDHPSYVSGEYDPPQHPACRCVWAYISKKEEDVPFDWEDPPPELREKHASWNEEVPWEIGKHLWPLDKAVRNIAREALPEEGVSSRPWESSPMYQKLRTHSKTALLEEFGTEEEIKKTWNPLKLSDWEDAKREDYFRRMESVQEAVIKKMGWKEDVDILGPKMEIVWSYSSSSETISRAMHLALNEFYGRPKDFKLALKISQVVENIERGLIRSQISMDTIKNSLLHRHAVQDELFETLGIKELEVFRGVRDRKNLIRDSVAAGEAPKISIRPLSSWTPNKEVADSFGGTLLKTTVSVKDVWLSYHTSHILLSVREVVVGFPGEMNLIGEAGKEIGGKPSLNLKRIP